MKGRQSNSVRMFRMDFLNTLIQGEPEFGDARIIQVQPVKLSGNKNFNADLWRLQLYYEEEGTLAPPTLIAKLPTAKEELNERARIFKPGLRENWFYRVAAPHSNVPVPRCYYNAIDEATGQSVLLLEDLAPARPGNQLSGATIEQAKLALEAAAMLHAAWWERSASPEIIELDQLLTPDFDSEQNLVQALFDLTWPRFLQQAGPTIPKEVVQLGSAISGNMAAVDRLIDNTPKTLAHGDLRLDNLFFRETRWPASLLGD